MQPEPNPAVHPAVRFLTQVGSFDVLRTASYEVVPVTPPAGALLPSLLLSCEALAKAQACQRRKGALQPRYAGPCTASQSPILSLADNVAVLLVSILAFEAGQFKPANTRMERAP